MPQSGHRKLIWSSGKEEPDVCVLGFVSICAAELALKGEAALFRNKIVAETSPKTVVYCFGSKWGKNCRRHGEEMHEVSSLWNISVLCNELCNEDTALVCLQLLCAPGFCTLQVILSSKHWKQGRQMLLFPPSPFCGQEAPSCCCTAALAPSLLLKLFSSSICQAVSRLLEPWKSFCWLQKSTQLWHSAVDLSHESFSAPFSDSN